MKPDHLEKIARAFTEGVIFCDTDGVILHINTIGKRILASHPSILSCSNLSVLSQVPELSFDKSIGRHIRSGQMTPLPKYVFDDRFRHCHFEGMRFATGNEKQPFLLMIKFWDQTIRLDRFAALNMSRLENQQNLQRYSQAIKQNEINMRLALNSAAESIWMLDVSANTIESELVWQKILGFESKTRAIGLDDFLSRVHPEDKAVLQRSITGLIDYETVLDQQYRIVGKGNKQYWFHIRGRTTARDTDGKALTLYGLHSDITASRLMEQKLTDTDVSLNVLLSSMTDGVFIASDERFIFANQAMLRILGYADENFINSPFAKVVDPEHLIAWQKRYRARAAGRSDIPSRYETKLVKANGEVIWVALIATRIDYQAKSSVMGIIHDITGQKATEKLIWHQANFDALTSLANRQHFEELLQQKAISAQRFNTSFVLALLDLDNFKDINDTQGHDCGDHILLQVAQRLNKVIGNKGTVGRFGGDEFVMLLDNIADMPTLETTLQQVLANIRKPISVNSSEFMLSASIGISQLPNDTRSPSVLLRNADQAMYAAKQSGRDRYSFFTAEMDVAAQNKLILINDLKAAVSECQWQLLYQPIVDLQHHKVTKAEALIRWQHPEKGVISPDAFIPLAEESGLILPIGQWVLEEAIKTARQFRQTISPLFQVSINQSSKQFQQHDERIPKLTDIIEQQQIEADMIAIEITESTLFDASQESMQKLEKLRDMGVEVAIDDFGTGYSSLSYLKKLDIDVLKIDRSFVWQLEKDSDDQVLVEAIILMAHTLGLKVIAEGVETREQLNILVRAGCDYGQGYLFSRPIPPDDLQRYAESFSWPLPVGLLKNHHAS